MRRSLCRVSNIPGSQNCTIVVRFVVVALQNLFFCLGKWNKGLFWGVSSLSKMLFPLAQKLLKR